MTTLLRAIVTSLLVLVMPHTIPASSRADDRAQSVLTARNARKVDEAIERGLAWIASQQKPNGAFPAVQSFEPGATSVCLLAFLACGHVPGYGKYGEILERGVNHIMSFQKEDGSIVPHVPDLKSSYVHGASALFLCEVYGMTSDQQASKMRTAIEKALRYTRFLQTDNKVVPEDRGGWRYYFPEPGFNSDLSATSWQLLFLRSAKAAGFEVPAEWIDEAFSYVVRCYHESERTFCYGSHGGDRGRITHGLSGTGILAYAMAGMHKSPEARRAGKWILDRGFHSHEGIERFYYAAFYCNQGMFQLGGAYWKKFYPMLVNTVLPMQEADGMWFTGTQLGGANGGTLVTALAVLALSTPNQVLPVLQR